MSGARRAWVATSLAMVCGGLALPASAGAAGTFFITDFVEPARLVLDGDIDVSWRVEATGGEAVAEQYVRVLSPGVRHFRRVAETGASPARVRVVSPGDYCVNVHARSVTGAVAGTPSPCVSVPFHARRLRRSAGWGVTTSSAMYLGSALQASRPGRSIVARTVIRWSYLVATTCPSCGAVDVYLDDEFNRRVSLRSSARRSRVPIVIVRTGMNRLRTLRVVTVDSRPVTIEGIALTKH